MSTSSSVRLRALVVGSGWAANAARAFAARDDVEVVGVVGRGSARSAALATELGVALATDLGAAIRASRPALAVVAVGDRQNPAAAAALVRAGVHVLCAHPVAPTEAEVIALADLARHQGVVVGTDYSLRATEAFATARAALGALGPLLRVDVVAPGRFLPMSLDLAIGLAGEAASVTAFGLYPDALAARRRAAPAAFPPTVVIEHRGGAVTSLVPSPHAPPCAPVRVIASASGGRLEASLPSGEVRRQRFGSGGFDDDRLVATTDASDAPSAFSRAMRRCANAFVEAILRGGPPPCSLTDEAHVRALWTAISVSVRTRSRVALSDKR